MRHKHTRCGHYVTALGICRRCTPSLWAEWHRAEVWWDDVDAAAVEAREPMWREVLAP